MKIRHWTKFTLVFSALFLYGCLFEWSYDDVFRSKTSTRYTVSKGDTIYEISQKFKVSMGDLIEINDLSSPYIIFVGQKLRIPGSAVATHIVRKGENIGLIAEKYNMKTRQLAQMNGLKKPYLIHPGQSLRINSRVKQGRKTSYDKMDMASTQIPANSKRYSAPTKRSGKYFSWPVKGKIVRKFGAYGEGLSNDGINILAPNGTAIKAAENGVVAYAGNGITAYGNLILIQHAQGWVTAYAHNSKNLVKTGDQVKRHQKIAFVGSTGNVSKSQLHFEIRQRKQAVNPLKHLKK